MKANRFTLFVLLLTMASLASCAVLGTGPATSAASTITVQGYGESSGDPDMATVSVGATVADVDIGRAVQESNKLIADLTAAMQELGISPADIQTTGFNVWPEDIYDPNSGQTTGEKRYHVDSTLQINIRNVDDVGKVLETAINNGANSVYGLSFGIQEGDGLAATARAEALADAQKRAEEMALGLGVTLGAVSAASDYSSGPPQPYFSTAMGRGGGSEQEQPPISQGQMTVGVSVSVSYEIVK